MGVCPSGLKIRVRNEKKTNVLISHVRKSFFDYEFLSRELETLTQLYTL